MGPSNGRNTCKTKTLEGGKLQDIGSLRQYFYFWHLIFVKKAYNIYIFLVFDSDIFVGDDSRVKISLTEAGLLALNDLSRNYFNTDQHIDNGLDRIIVQSCFLLPIDQVYVNLTCLSEICLFLMRSKTLSFMC